MVREPDADTISHYPSSASASFRPIYLALMGRVQGVTNDAGSVNVIKIMMPNYLA